MDCSTLTRKQLDTLYYEFNSGKKSWKNKIPHLLKIIQTFQNSNLTITENNIEEFKQSFEDEIDFRHKEHYKKQLTGEIEGRFTPTDISKSSDLFLPVDSPEIGRKYHLSWAHKAAVFVLKFIEGDKVYLDNPRYKRDRLLVAKLSDLRSLK